MGQALYRKYRSKSLKDVVGQSHVTDVLSRALAKNQLAHAYLLTGPRGIGKTSIARILAHEITKLPYDGSSHLDIIEIDAASNNGVEDIRDLRDKVQVAPVQAAKKVYIIDEVHMLSKPAFNALLKTLEEPPAHIVFILATTDVEKLPPTIISRTQRFNLRRITEADAVGHLTKIAKQEKIAIEPAAIELLATYGDGSFRDAINLLDQLSSLRGEDAISAADIEQHLGIAPSQLIDRALQAYLAHDLNAIVALLDQLESDGVSVVLFGRQLLQAATTQIVTQPELLPLLDDLVAVESSRRPEVALLVALARNAWPNTPSAPPATIGPAPASPPSASPDPQTVSPADAPAASRPAPSPNQPATDKADPKPASSKPSKTAPKASQKPPAASAKAAEQDYPWDNLISAIKSESIGLYDLLKKSGRHYDGQTLTIYAGNRLYKSKLDTTRYRSLLLAKSEALNAQVNELAITADKPPIVDSALASVASLMGGGEMVDIS